MKFGFILLLNSTSGLVRAQRGIRECLCTCRPWNQASEQGKVNTLWKCSTYATYLANDQTLILYNAWLWGSSGGQLWFGALVLQCAKWNFEERFNSSEVSMTAPRQLDAAHLMLITYHWPSLSLMGLCIVNTPLMAGLPLWCRGGTFSLQAVNQLFIPKQKIIKILNLKMLNLVLGTRRIMAHKFVQRKGKLHCKT